MNEPIRLNRACEALEIPSGICRLLPVGALVRISQSMGDSYTITTEHGKMYRIEGKDADALGFSINREVPASQPGRFSEEAVWAELRTVFDPEIPINIADLGLIYSCVITPHESGNRIDIKMSLTAPGCGMADVLKADVERKLSRLPGVKEVSIEVVCDPPWEPSRMSEAAKLELGLDLELSPSTSALPILKSGR